MNRILSLVFCFAVATCVATAQSLSVKNVTLLPKDRTALDNPCLDSNGDTCALIKIKVTGVEGLEFLNKSQYVRYSYADGMYMVYVPTISRRLDYGHSDYLPGQIDMGEYGYRRLRAGKTYLVQIEASSGKKENSILVLKVNPLGARVLFDESRVGLSSTGIYEFTLPEGSHTYTVTMDDYKPLDGMIQVSKNENKTIALNLEPIMHKVKVNCNVSKAHVFVDNVDFGEAGILSLPQGNHHIRIQGDGYIDVEEDVTIMSNMVPLSYSLKKNKNVKEIHAIPVRIFTKASRVFKNKKEIRDWSKDGDKILMMPGVYELSDNDGHLMRIEVGTEPMDVYLSGSKPIDNSGSTNTNKEKEEVKNKYSQKTYYNSYLQQRNTNNSRSYTRDGVSAYPNRRTNNPSRSNYQNGHYRSRLR